jgi:hypothetical protein
VGSRSYLAKACLAGGLVGALGVLACDGASGPTLPADAEQFAPPVVYTTWWNMTRACSGLSGSLGAVTWLKTSQVLHDPKTGEIIIGYWTSGNNRIVMTANAVLDGGAVRHEMLHALVQKGGHPRDQFLGKCAGTVRCEGACILDAGPYPPPPQTPVHISADGMNLSLAIDPQNPGGGANGGFFTITVTARNPTANWATVLPLFPDDDTTRTFSFAVHGAAASFSGEEMAFDPSERIFAPGETKRWVFDFRVGDDAFSRQLPAGDYTIRGAYSNYWTNDVPLVVAK